MKGLHQFWCKNPLKNLSKVTHFLNKFKDLTWEEVGKLDDQVIIYFPLFQSISLNF